ncbi:MAG: hypothetical protein VKN83_04600 [Cyanobacteriota bacterium]|jgi:hypothetical protein|nr:hypothetical protein [Cyanobacteriota bacterium]
MTGTHIHQLTSCLSRTCLRWTPEGELERDDLQQILARLAAVDGYGTELRLSRGAGNTPST